MSSRPPNGASPVEQIALSDNNGLVVMHFEQATEWVALEPATAVALGEQMARQAYRAQFGDFPTPQKKSFISDQVALRLRNRVTLMLRSMAADGTSPEVQAARVVDACLSEVS